MSQFCASKEIRALKKEGEEGKGQVDGRVIVKM